MFKIKNIVKQAKKCNKTIVFPEASFSERIMSAAKIVKDKKIAKVILLGDESALILRYKNLEGMTIINPKTSDITQGLINLLMKRRKDKGLTFEEAEQLALDPIYFGVLLVEAGIADGMVAGAETTSSKVIKPALQIIKSKKQNEIVSSFMIFCGKNKMLGKDGVMFGADVGLNINPTDAELAQIAKATAKSFEKFTNMKARVALLSYSTNGSAGGESAEKVKSAMEILKKEKEMIIGGEMQFDAAVVPEVAKLKQPKSVIKGDANILVFPELNSGNICYKAIQYFGKTRAIGPIMQGLNKPVNDLSRGCNVDDIVLVTAITVLQAN